MKNCRSVWRRRQNLSGRESSIQSQYFSDWKTLASKVKDELRPLS